ncbi:hypothetical protein [Niabella aquatica]
MLPPVPAQMISCAVRSASYAFGKWGGASIAEAVKRFPGRLITTAFNARGNQFCTVVLLARELFLN